MIYAKKNVAKFWILKHIFNSKILFYQLATALVHFFQNTFLKNDFVVNLLFETFEIIDFFFRTFDAETLLIFEKKLI
jgi:hypothetical protein